MDQPFLLTIWDKSLNRLGFVADPISVTVTPRHNAIGSLDLTVALSDDVVPLLTPRGGRITCTYKGAQIFSGPRRPLNAQGPTQGGTITLSYEDDIRLLWNLLGYAVPANTADNQTATADVRTGPAETVVKGYLSANKGRHPKTITVAANQGRGSSISGSVRMVPLADELIDKVDGAGIGLSVRQNGSSGLVVDCYTPATVQRALTEIGGGIRSYTWTENPFTANGGVVGGPNEGKDREFRRVDNTASQTEWGDLIETVIDASDKTLIADIIVAGNAALAAAGPTAGFSIELAETDIFHYGGDNGIHVGDSATANIAGQTITDVIREVALSWDRGNGLVVKPAVGDHSDDPNTTLLAFLQRLARGVRKQQAR